MEFEKLKKIIADVLNLDESEVKEESTFVEDFGADSLDIFQIITGVEDEFKIEVPLDALENVKTVGDVVKLLKSSM